MKDLKFIKINDNEIINFDVIKSIIHKNNQTELHLKNKADGFMSIPDKSKAIFTKISNLLLK